MSAIIQFLRLISMALFLTLRIVVLIDNIRAARAKEREYVAA